MIFKGKPLRIIYNLEYFYFNDYQFLVDKIKKNVIYSTISIKRILRQEAT